MPWKRLNKITALHELTTHLSASHSIDDLIQIAIGQIVKVLHPDVLFFYQRKNDNLQLKESWQASDFAGRLSTEIRKVCLNLCYSAASEKRPFYSHNTHNDTSAPLSACKRAGLKSLAALPLYTQSEVSGAIILAAFTERNFQQDSLFLEILSTHISNALANILVNERLSEAKKTMQAVIDAAPVAIMALDHKGKVTKWSLGAEHMFGWNEEELLGRFNPLVPTDKLEEFNNNFKEMTEGKIFSREACCQRKDGSLIDVILSTTTLRNTVGEIIGTVDVMTDISERKRHEEDLRQRDRLLSESQSIAHIGSWTWEIATDKITWTDETYRIYRLSPETIELSPNLLLNLLHPDDRPEMQAWVSACIAGKNPGDLEFRIILPDGGIRLLSYRGNLEYNAENKPFRLVGTVQDITERRKVEADLIKSEERFLQIAENINEAFWVTDIANSEIIYASPVYERIWGRTCESLYKEPRTWLEAIHPDERGKAVAADIETPFTGISDQSYRIIKPDGSVHWIRNRAFPIKNNVGKIYRIIRIAEDITNSKKLEDTLRQAQKMEAIGQLASGVAHDFNNILSAIIGYTHLTATKMSEDDPLKGHLEKVLQATERATALTHSLLALSRKQPLTLQPVDLNELVGSFYKFILRLLPENIELNTSYSNDDLRIIVDRSQIEQVLMNLITNARDAMPEGGQLSLETRLTKLEEQSAQLYGLEKAGDYAQIILTDTGCGMDGQTLHKIFEPFFTTKELGKGTGLGLAIVYGIIKKHGGGISVYSEPSKLTSFSIYLPLQNPDSEDIAEQKINQLAKGGNETILIAEDNEYVRKLSNTVLAHYGYNIIEAVDGEDAVRQFMANKEIIQLVILDGIMPKKNGKEVYDTIKAFCPNIKVIFMSGYSEEIFRSKNLIESGLTCLLKPVSPNDLLMKVRAILDT